jgi:histidinol-phosphatase (PHP family)
VDFDLTEFGEQIDDILQTIIRKDRILEINSSSKQLKQRTIPALPIIQRYYELGGRKVSFGSDAHNCERIMEKRDEVVAALKEIGFTYITVPCRGEHIKVEI